MSRLSVIAKLFRLLLVFWIAVGARDAAGADLGQLPSQLQTVLRHTNPIENQNPGRLPLYVLPISNTLSSIDDATTEQVLRALAARGIGYSVDWNPGEPENSVQEGLRIARFQRQIRMPVAVNANACLYSFFDGSEDTLHIADDGKRFAEESFGGKLGCPFRLSHRVPVIKKRVETFLRAYKEAGVKIDFIFADWEIDGPIEWNDAWDTCRRCQSCRQNIPNINDFRAFQSKLRDIRSEIQRVAFGDNVTGYFPQALVGNYGVYPHNGMRYWYDYFEKESEGYPVIKDQRARYREWAHEFSATGYTFAMPVVYTWYPTFAWYDFKDTDYRWFYNMLLTASNAGAATPPNIPIISFVHWTTTAPPPNPSTDVVQMSQAKYKDLLWHLFLRGHDTLFLWCTANELSIEVGLVHEVYADSMAYSDFIQRGTPISFEVPKDEGPVISGLRIGNRVLVMRTNFGSKQQNIEFVELDDNQQIEVPSESGLYILTAAPRPRRSGEIVDEGKVRFPIGFYEHPRSDVALEEMAQAGVNLVRCGGREDLDRVDKLGMMGWVSLPVQEGATEGLRQQIESVKDHPALAVWEGPDEIVWTFTAYSFLKERAGFTREDWNNQTKKAVEYSEKHGPIITKGIRDGVELVRSLDDRRLPFWINEAADSDVKFCRQYMNAIDITGCDYYAVRSEGSDLPSVGRLVKRWNAIGQGRPVWMVLQGFSWHSIHPTRKKLYPTFEQTRFMAFDSIVHGAKGILYWGSNEIDDPRFRQSLYALTSELASIEAFLVGDLIEEARVDVIDDLFDPPGIGVRVKSFRAGNDHLVVLVNEDNHRHLGVDVSGLSHIDGRPLYLLYGEENAVVEKGRFVTRLQPFQVKTFCTSRRFETARRAGRAYVQDRVSP